MKTFHIKDKVKLSDELLQHSANKRWIGKTGEVVKVTGENMCLVKWEHIVNPIEEYFNYIESV